MNASHADARELRRGLRAAARAALSYYDFKVRTFRLVTDSFNCVYRVESVSGDSFALRITSAQACHGVEETQAELAWLAALAREECVAVPRPVARLDGKVMGVLDPDLAPLHRQCVLFEWLPGRLLGGQVGVRSSYRLGRIAASLHEHARSFELSQGRVRRFDHVFPYADPAFSNQEPVLVLDDRFRRVCSPDLHATYERAIHWAQATIDKLFSGPSQPQLIHNDLHLWNVLVRGDQLAVIDFEDLMWGYAIQDIATTLYYLRIRSNAASLESAFRRGYESRGKWPTCRESDLDALIGARGLMLVNTLLASPRSEDQAQVRRYLPLIGTRLSQWQRESTASPDLC